MARASQNGQKGLICIVVSQLIIANGSRFVKKKDNNNNNNNNNN